MILVLFAMGWGGCRFVHLASVDQDRPYNKETQLAYFEGQKHLLKGDLDEAHARFLNCAEAEPDEIDFHYQLGKIDLELKRFESAENHFNLAAFIEPDNTWVRYHRGLSRLAQGNGPGAEEDWTLFVVARPGNLDALFECSNRLLNEGQILPALNLLSHYEEQVGKDIDVRLEAWRISKSTVDLINLERFLETARKDFPEDVYIQLEWIRHLLEMESMEACHDALHELQRIRPGWGPLEFQWAEYWSRMGDLERARSHMRRAFASDEVPTDQKLGMAMVYGLLAMQDASYHDVYSELIQLLIERHGEVPAVMELGREWEYHNGRLPEALDLALDLVETTPESSDAWFSVISLRMELAQWEELVVDAQSAIDRFPLDPVFHYYQGLALRETKQSGKAVKTYEAGLNVLIDNPVLEGALASALASALRDLKEFDKSEAAFERSIQAHEDAYVLNNHAYYLAGRHTMEQSANLLERALECSTRANELMPWEGNFMDTQAYILYKMGRFEEALVWIMRAEENGTMHDPVALEHEGDIRWALQQHDEARAVWRQALEAGGDPEVLGPKIHRP